MVDRIQARLRGEGGFTIIELMIVLLIIGILLALGLAKFAPAVNAAKSLKAQAQVSNAVKDAMGYYAVDGNFDAVTGDTEGENNPLTSVSLTVAEGSCTDNEPAATGEGTLDYCTDDLMPEGDPDGATDVFGAATVDHSENTWAASISDGEIVAVHKVEEE